MKITRTKDYSPEYRLDNVLQKMIQIHKHGSSTITIAQLWADIEKDYFTEVEDYDDETGPFMNSYQIAPIVITDIELLEAIIENLLQDGYINTRSGGDNFNYYVTYKGRRFTGYQNAAKDQNKKALEERIIKLLAITTIIPCIHDLFEIVRQYYYPIVYPLRWCAPILIIFIPYLLYRINKQ